MASREAFLDRVRQAVRQGNRPGDAASLPDRGQVGYQGAGQDHVSRFAEELAKAGGRATSAASHEAACKQVMEWVRAKGVRKVLLGRGAVIDSIPMATRLAKEGISVVVPDGEPNSDWRDPFFAADLGITGVDYLIAETGSIVIQAKPGEPRSFSLLPPVHIAVAHKSQVLPDLFDLLGQVNPESMPSGMNIITGPSKTGDIELRLVTGVHGPGEVCVVVIDD